MGIKDKLPFLTPTYVEKTIGTTSIRFYPVSVKGVYKVGMLAKPIGKALAILLSNEQTSKITRKPIEGGKGGMEITADAVTPETSKQLIAQRAEAFETLITAATEGRNMLMLCELFCDSLRDVFPGGASMTDAEELRDALDVANLAVYLEGFVEANGKIVTPFVAKFREAQTGSLNGTAPQARILPLPVQA